MLVVPDWSVVAAGAKPHEPAAVLFANRVVAASPAAKAEAVTVGLRRREAQGRCPELAILTHDPARDAREFEPVVAALDDLTPRIEITEPGRCAFATRGPARYFGGDESLAAKVKARAQVVVGDRGRVHVGVADGPFAALVAAGDDRVVLPGKGSDFLAGLPIGILSRAVPPELVDVFRRLGLRTLGALAALPAPDVLARFGPDGALAHRLAAGRDEREPATTPPPPELAVQIELDPPVERVDAVAFAARSLAEGLQHRLAARGEACTQLLIMAETDHGERLERLWRLDERGSILDLVRWQLEGWLIDPTGARSPGHCETGGLLGRQGNATHRPTAGITLLRLVPEAIAPAVGRQLGFWGGTAGADERALRALARLEGLLGPTAVTVPEWRGGRDLTEQLTLVPAAAVDLNEARPSALPAADPPWPGRLPAPSPATVLPERLPATVVDANDEPVQVSGRGALSAPPARFSVHNGPWRAVRKWAGPWPVEQRWWDPAAHSRRARFQIVADDGTARLLVIEGGTWWLEALYD